MRNVKVEEGDALAALVGRLGHYNPKTDTILLNDISHDVLLHEVQHIIQHLEGFANGGNPNAISKVRQSNNRVRRQVNSLLSDLGIDEWLSSIDDDVLERLEKKHAVTDREFNAGYMFADSMNSVKGDALRNKLDEANRIISENNEMVGGEHKALTPRQHYDQLAGEVEARNVQTRMNMTAEERRASLAEETEDVAREDQIFIMENAGNAMMGSRVNGFMADIGRHFEGVELDDAQKAVVEVYSGKSNNLPVEVERKDDKRKVVMRQGTENKAGTKHSLFRHYKRGEGNITAEDLLLIPEVLRDGEMKTVKNGRGTEYSLVKDGVRYKVYTETKKGIESFCDFYTNKKGNRTSTSTSEEEASNQVENTQLSARGYDSIAKGSAKVGNESETGGVGEPETYREVAQVEVQEEQGKSHEEMAEAARALSAKLGVPVEVVTDVEEITHPNAAVAAKRRRAKGWYEKGSGRVVVVVPNHADVEDVAATVFHEVVAHRGLRELVGEQGYDEFLMEVFGHAKEEVRERIMALAGKHGWDIPKAVDEYLGGLAERGFEDFSEAERGMWQWLKAKVLEAIDKFIGTLKLPKSVKLGDNELRYLLWRSHENLRAGREGMVERAKDTAKRYELGLTENAAGERSGVDDLYRTEYREAAARDAYERRVKSGLYQSREALQDSMLGLRTAMEEVLKADGSGYSGRVEDIPGFNGLHDGERDGARV